MSRVGQMPITVPQGVTVKMVDDEITVSGPKGELSRRLNPDMSISQNDDVLSVSRPSDNREHRALHGLTRTLVANMVEGVSNGFERYLEIVGVGYRAQKQDTHIILNIGFSHQVDIEPLPGISLDVEGNNRIKVSGIDKEVVGEMAARIRATRPPDAYKGKGIRYRGEVVHLKAGKAGKAIGR